MTALSIIKTMSHSYALQLNTTAYIKSQGAWTDLKTIQLWHRMQIIVVFTEKGIPYQEPVR